MNQSEYKIRNLESSILYIQQEHANTLKLLHEEIKELQMKNSELSFQIAMENVGGSKEQTLSENKPDYSDLLHQIDKLKEEVRVLTLANETKLTQLGDYENKIRQLTSNIDKLKDSQKSQMMAAEMELNNKSAEIVLLSTKLHNWKKLEIRRSSIGDLDTNLKALNKPLLVPQSPLGQKIFKFRNQISVHPDDNHIRCRPIVAHHAMISAPHQMKTKTVPLGPEFALSTEGKTNFSKSIRRPNILPPINPVRTSFHCSDKSCIVSHRSSSIDSGYEKLNFNTILNSTEHGSSSDDYKSLTSLDINSSYVTPHSKDQKIIQVDIDRVMDMSNSSLLTSAPPVKCNLYRNHSS